MSSMPKRVSIFRSVATKFAFAVVLSISVVVLPLLMLQNSSLGHLASESLAKQAEGQGKLLASALPAPVAFEKYGDIDGLLGQFEEGVETSYISFVVVGAEGAIIAKHGPNPDETLANFARSALGADSHINLPNEKVLAFPLMYGKARNVGAFAMRWSLGPLADFLEATQIKSLIAAAVAGFLAVGATILAFHGIILKPMSALTKTVEALRLGEFTTEVASASRSDEFGITGKAVDHLRAELEAAAAGARDASFKREAFNSSSAALVLADQNGVIFAVNPAFEDMCKIRNEQFQNCFPHFDARNLVGKLLDFFGSNPAEKMDHIGSNGEAFETIISMDDVRISMKIKAIHGSDNQKIGFVLEWQDVTNVWKNTALINELNTTQLRAEFSPDGNLLDANEIFSATIKRTEPTGVTTLTSLISSDLEELNETLKKDRSFVGKMRFQGADGCDVIVEGSITSVIGTDQKPYRLILLGRDITEVEHAAEKAQWERAELNEERAKVVNALRVAFKRLRDGHLHVDLSEPFADRYEELRQDYNSAIGQMCQALRGIADRAETIRNESQDIRLRTH